MVTLLSSQSLLRAQVHLCTCRELFEIYNSSFLLLCAVECVCDINVIHRKPLKLQQVHLTVVFGAEMFPMRH